MSYIYALWDLWPDLLHWRIFIAPHSARNLYWVVQTIEIGTKDQSIGHKDEPEIDFCITPGGCYEVMSHLRA